MSVINNIAGKNVLLIGGGSGMGRASALALSNEGAKVVIAGRKIEPLEMTASLAENPDSIFSQKADVTDRESIDHLYQWFDKQIGRLDFLVHAAGINVAMRSMKELSPEEWDKLININLTGTYNVMRLALDRMRLQKQGLIILLNSVAGRRSVPLAGIGYNASKFGMSGLGVGVAEEEKENGIRVTNIYPGEVNTPILDNRKIPPTQDHRESILQSEDIASVVMHICGLPERAHIPEIVIKPVKQSFV